MVDIEDGRSIVDMAVFEKQDTGIVLMLTLSSNVINDKFVHPENSPSENEARVEGILMEVIFELVNRPLSDLTLLNDVILPCGTPNEYTRSNRLPS